MTTNARRKIPRLVCTSGLSALLLVSGGATTAIAASESPSDVLVSAVRQVGSSDPSGDDQDTTDSSADTGSDTGNTNEDASHPRTDTGNTNEDASHPRTDTGNTNEDAGTKRGDSADDQQTGNTHKQSSNDGGGAAHLKRACEKVGRSWVKTSNGGYCGDSSPSGKVNDKEVADALKETCAGLVSHKIYELLNLKNVAASYVRSEVGRAVGLNEVLRGASGQVASGISSTWGYIDSAGKEQVFPSAYKWCSFAVDKLPLGLNGS
ncbi:hypothetical protein ABT083_23745 [Streptomyces goshikiensis]|uniref:hypothetical protein n=1 Tax=Streptomyces goshikiensis TaxID=1942 RepID=UPI0033296164